MNAREGMRRLGILLGILGMLAGAVIGWMAFRDYRYQRNEWEKFQNVTSRKTMKNILKHNSSFSKFGKQIKIAYPGAYDDFPDSKLGYLVSEQYPFWYKAFETAGFGRRKSGKPWEQDYGDKQLPKGFLSLGPDAPKLEPGSDEPVIVEVALDGVKTITMDNSLKITKIELNTGDTIYNRDEPSTLETLSTVFSLPLIGFLLPWGILKTITWVALGFFQRTRGVS